MKILAYNSFLLLLFLNRTVSMHASIPAHFQ